jgi:hypothetical protein
MAADEGPIQTVGWGIFALPGERKRLRKKEEARMAEMKEVVEKAREGANTAGTVAPTDFHLPPVAARQTAQTPPGHSAEPSTNPEGGQAENTAPQVGSEGESAVATASNELEVREVSIRKPPGPSGGREQNLYFSIALHSDDWKNWETVAHAVSAYIDSVPEGQLSPERIPTVEDFDVTEEEQRSAARQQ